MLVANQTLTQLTHFNQHNGIITSRLFDNSTKLLGPNYDRLRVALESITDDILKS